MDYTEVCQGWIYYIQNKVNGKMYIGQTNHFDRRKYQHFNKKETCPLLEAAFNKYGKENFEMVPILSFKAINKEVLAKVLDYLEVFYIKKYGTFKYGYNATQGGDGSLGRVVSEDTRSKIANTLTGTKLPGDLKSKLSLLRRKDNIYPILQYSLDGNFIKEYPYAAVASQEIDGSNRYAPLIYEVARGNKRIGIGYMWRFKDSKSFPLHISPYKCIRTKRKFIYLYSKEGVLLKQFNSAAEAADYSGQSENYIMCAANLKRKSRRRNYWSREAPYS